MCFVLHNRHHILKIYFHVTKFLNMDEVEVVQQAVHQLYHSVDPEEKAQAEVSAIWMLLMMSNLFVVQLICCRIDLLLLLSMIGFLYYFSSFVNFIDGTPPCEIMSYYFFKQSKTRRTLLLRDRYGRCLMLT